VALEMNKALVSGDLDLFGDLLDFNWAQQKALHPSIVTKEMEEIELLARKAGATGGKACGAGGGGCFLFYCGEGADKVRKRLRDAKVRVLDFKFDFDGLVAEQVE